MGEELTVNGTTVYVARPSTPPAAGVLVLHEVWGLNDDIRRIADRFASIGYLAAAPDLVDGGRLPCMIRALRELGRGEGPTVDRTRRLLAWLRDHPECDGRVAVAGFCLGAGFALLLAGLDRPAAVSAAYGAPPDDDELVARSCPVVAHVGDRDRIFAPGITRLERILDEAGVPHDVKVYPGAGHSFMNRAEPSSRLLGLVGRLVLRVAYDDAAAEDAWRRIERFFARYVREEPEVVVDLTTSDRVVGDDVRTDGSGPHLG